ncbi:MAG TPA: HI0074 family nucleotidyltransferase substrate-binding subunit [Bacillales bacterium]|nr:HI0074 family nucleotidyltransferase substrate-binding subunit [Bacillales bacterium]
MSVEKVRNSLDNLGRSLDRFGESLGREIEDQLLIDGVIQRFEFTIELFWKTLKRMLEFEGVQASSPKQSLKQAYQLHWIDDEQTWLDMLKDRDRTSYTYGEALANEIYQRFKGYYPEMRKTHTFLRGHFVKENGRTKNNVLPYFHFW